jgi:hypothetical protein
MIKRTETEYFILSNQVRKIDGYGNQMPIPREF